MFIRSSIIWVSIWLRSGISPSSPPALESASRICVRSESPPSPSEPRGFEASLVLLLAALAFDCFSFAIVAWTASWKLFSPCPSAEADAAGACVSASEWGRLPDSIFSNCFINSSSAGGTPPAAPLSASPAPLTGWSAGGGGTSCAVDMRCPSCAMKDSVFFVSSSTNSSDRGSSGCWASAAPSPGGPLAAAVSGRDSGNDGC